MLKRYKTVAAFGEAEIVEKKSRFLAAVTPIETETAAHEFLEGIRKKHWNASHHVFAYQIGFQNEIQRMSDDGEPSGTAGLPVLDVLRGQDIKNTMIVVTRYFGGTLLGTGGLVKAYGKAAKEGLQAAQVVERVLVQQSRVVVEYPLLGKVQYEIVKSGSHIVDTIYTDTVAFLVQTETTSYARFQQIITEATNGTAWIEELDRIYCSIGFAE